MGLRSYYKGNHAQADFASWTLGLLGAYYGIYFTLKAVLELSGRTFSSVPRKERSRKVPAIWI